MKKKSTAKTPVWNLGMLYKSPEDPQIEKDIQKIEKDVQDFANTFDVADKKYLTNKVELKKALQAFENLSAELECKPLFYFNFLSDSDARNTKATSFLSLISNRMAKAYNKITFFEVSLGTIPLSQQTELLADKELTHFRVFLERIFSDAKYTLSVAEEKILNLKSLPAHDMWVDSNDRALSKLSVKWKGEILPFPEADHLIHTLRNAKERHALAAVVNEQLKSIASFSEAEINAVFTNKKINDELRGYTMPYDGTVRSYRNDPQVVKNLVQTVTQSFPIAHRFFKIKAKLLKLKKLNYADRKIGIGEIKTKFPFDSSLDLFEKMLLTIDPKFKDILNSYLKNGQIDVSPRIGKKGGAYCWGGYSVPTFVLLNHTNDINSLSTLAHEMGHAFHSEFSRAQGPLYSDYSFALAETASTLFEAMMEEAVLESLDDSEKIIMLHDKINGDISTVFRQIACFNFELDLHEAVRSKGFVSKEHIAELHNKNMKAYLGPLFGFKPDDGYFFVTWGHIRRFFYVYSYAYGQLVSKAMLRRYRQDKNFWKSIEQFLSAGGKASPEEILKEIGIDVSKPDFWKEGLKQIEDDIVKLEKLVKKK